MKNRNKILWIGFGVLLLVSIVVIYYVSTSGTDPAREFIDVGWWNIRDFGTSSRDDHKMIRMMILTGIRPGRPLEQQMKISILRLLQFM
jgi:hypothetical protein